MCPLTMTGTICSKNICRRFRRETTDGTTVRPRPLTETGSGDSRRRCACRCSGNIGMLTKNTFNKYNKSYHLYFSRPKAGRNTVISDESFADRLLSGPDFTACFDGRRFCPKRQGANRPTNCRLDVGICMYGGYSVEHLGTGDDLRRGYE